jgi:two-component sensor histidine kinase
VKNNMQVIYSLLSLQSAEITDAAALSSFRESQHRVKTMALLHENLYQLQDLSRIDFQSYVRNLLDYLFSSFGTDPEVIQRRVEVRDISLSLDAAIPCGLIINELASNALKYAFPDRSAGEMTLTMNREEEGSYHLRFRDNGVGLPADVDLRKTKSLGLKLVTMLTEQLHGTVEVENKGGTGFHIVFQDRHQMSP